MKHEGILQGAQCLEMEYRLLSVVIKRRITDAEGRAARPKRGTYMSVLSRRVAITDLLTVSMGIT